MTYDDWLNVKKELVSIYVSKKIMTYGDLVTSIIILDGCPVFKRNAQGVRLSTFISQRSVLPLYMGIYASYLRNQQRSMGLDFCVMIASRTR